MIGISFEASSICLSSISVKPVVPIIKGFLYSLASWTRDIVDSGLEKSITTSESLIVFTISKSASSRIKLFIVLPIFPDKPLIKTVFIN